VSDTPRTLTPTDVVFEALRLVGSGDHDAAAAVFADTVDFSIAHAPGIPWIPDVRSGADMAVFFAQLAEHVEIEELDVHTTVSQGDDVVLLGRLRNTVKHNGRTMTTNFALHTTVKDQRITRYHLYEDTYAVAQAYFGESGA
jgi:uncharacterized protein